MHITGAIFFLKSNQKKECDGVGKIITLYHGSEQVVGNPAFGSGSEHNDFGRGFYCTADKDLAKEWAVSVPTGLRLHMMFGIHMKNK